MTADLHFHFDPICPFAWITSRWVVQVVEQKEYTVDWRFIALRIVNKDKDYERDFPAGYEYGHTSGLRLLRVAAAVRAEGGSEAVGRYYTAAGESIFDRDRVEGDDLRWRGTPEHAEQILEAAGLPIALGERPRRHVVGRSDRSGDRCGAGEDRTRRRDPDHRLPSARRTRVLRSGDLPDPRPRRRGGAVGFGDPPGDVPRLRRAQAQLAREAPPQEPRVPPRGGPPASRTGGAARFDRESRHDAADVRRCRACENSRSRSTLDVEPAAGSLGAFVTGLDLTDRARRRDARRVAHRDPRPSRRVPARPADDARRPRAPHRSARRSRRDPVRQAARRPTVRDPCHQGARRRAELRQRLAHRPVVPARAAVVHAAARRARSPTTAATPSGPTSTSRSRRCRRGCARRCGSSMPCTRPGRRTEPAVTSTPSRASRRWRSNRRRRRTATRCTRPSPAIPRPAARSCT